MTKKINGLLITLSVVLICGAVWADDFDDAEVALEKKDYVTAFEKFKIVAMQGNVGGQHNLGLMYDQGQGVVQNFAEAARWYKLAALQGHQRAQYNLGVHYYNGYGVAQDFIRAHMWGNLSAVNGDADAVKLRDASAKQMTSQQVAEAQKLARECLARNFKNCD